MRLSQTPAPAHNLALVGFMAAGKTTVGRLLARALGWDFLDFDDEIARIEGRTVAEIFRHDGELAFRAMESRLTAGLSSVRRTVLAPGGGWIVQPGNLDCLPPGTVTIWLRVSAGEALRRAAAAGVERPLLAAAADPLTEARALLRSREPFYGRADLAIDVDDRTPADIVQEIRRTIRTVE